MLNRHPLKTKIVLATLAIFLVGMWTLALYAGRVLRDDMEEMLGGQQFSTASIVAAHVNRELAMRISALTEVARLSADLMPKGPAALQALLDQRWELADQFNSGCFVTGTDGVAIAAAPFSYGRVGVSYADRDYVASVLRDGRPTISEPLVGRRANVPVLIVAVPIVGKSGKVVGVLGGVINLGLPNFLDEIAERPLGKTGGIMLVVPSQRLVATATDKSRVMERLPPPGSNLIVDRFIAGYEGSLVAHNPHGKEMLASAKRVPLTGWYIAIYLPTEEAFAPIRELNKRILLATLALSALIFVWIGWVVKRQLLPLLNAADVLAEMSEEKRPLEPLPIVRQDEIGQVIGGFNRLLTALGQREALLKQVMDTSSVAIFLVDMQGRITQANRRMYEMFGWPPDSLIGHEYTELIHPLERESGRRTMLQLLASEMPSVDLDRLYWRADQTQFWGHLTGRVFIDAEQSRNGLVGVIADISERKQVEEKLHLIASVFTHAREGITITAADGTIIDVNESFTRITGYSRDEVVGKNPRVLKSEHHNPEFYAAMWRAILEQGHWSGEIWNRRKNGEFYAEMLTISAVRDEKGMTEHYVALFTDITPLKEHEKQLEQMAHYDVLTTLPNRVLLADRLRQAMVQAMRRSRQLAVVYIDLDGFKTVNDMYGHKTGDQLLVALAGRMRQTLRESDTLARLGGDEFVAVLSDQEEVASCVPMLNRLLTAASQPVVIEGESLQVSASLGVAFYPQTEDADADQLLRQADQAMYQAKLAGKNRYHVFNAERDRHIRGQHESLEHIRAAIVANEFELHYQPKVNMRTGRVIGAEALIRWRHPERGLLPPSVFLPVVEEHPLSVTLGQWVFEAAVAQVRRWRGEGLDLPVSVNVGAFQLQQRDFVLRLRQLLQANLEIRPGDLEIEVLETSALEDLARVSQVIEECRELGVRFALDDFGTGYSSLNYLKRLAVDELKIDQSFVRDMLDDPDDLTILEGIVSLATAFRREVIAEGVETVEHGTLLLQLGCECAQGYGIARPMRGESVPAWVKAWRPDPAWLNLRPVDREGLGVLLTRTEHRAWMNALTKYLQGETQALPPLELNKCRFGEWLAHQPTWRDDPRGTAHASLERVHQQLHELAAELSQKRQQGSLSPTDSGMLELQRLSDRLIEALSGRVDAHRN